MRAKRCAIALMLLVLIPVHLQAEGSLAAARELYASAAYDDALTMLDALASDAKATDERQSIDLYRTLCLVALGRTSEADRAIEAIIYRDPLYRASLDDVSPRLRAAFIDARKRMLPVIIQKQYADAKAAFDSKDFEKASTGFAAVLAGLADPDIAPLVSTPPLSDIRTLASGFKELSVTLVLPPPPAPAPAAPVAEPPKPTRSLYGAGDANVVAPAVIQQRVPKYPGAVFKTATGMIELVIDEKGVVVSRSMRESIDPMFDRALLAAAEKWQYQPATLNGTPVKFLKRLSITVSPTAP